MNSDTHRAPPFAFKCPQYLHDAMTAAARADFCSRSDVIRRALIEFCSQRGHLKLENAAVAAA